MQTHGVTVRSIRALRGPNRFAYMPVLHILLDVGDYLERASSDFPGFVERLTDWLPGLYKHECSVGRPGGFIERLRRGTYLAHISEHITLELQTLLGFDVRFGRARSTDETGVYNVLIAYREEQPARAAFDTALRLTLAAMHDEPFDMAHELEQLHLVADEYRLGPSTGAIVEAARAARIPVLRLTEKSSLVQLGYGVYQKRIMASETSNTSAIAVEICQEKPLTNKLLRSLGLPVPAGRTVASASEAWEAAQEIGLPIVVKPENGNQGKGVSVNLTDEAEIGAAYAIAAQFGAVLVERFIAGDDYRLLVINGKLAAAARRDPALVVGDGEHTVRELVEITNRDPRRRPGHASILTQINLDAAAELVLRHQRLTPDSVPEAGQIARLRTNANLSTGGTAADVTDNVHPANARVAELAAQFLNLDVAGIDIVCRDITRPLAEQGGAIVEVNAAPGLRMHLYPTQGKPRDVGKAIVEMLYPEDAPSRIPIIAVTGTNGKTTVTRLVAHMYETARWVVGMTCTEGIYINQERIVAGDASGPKSAQTVLLHPRVEVAVLETARGGIVREGLAFDSCTVAVVTNISPDHIGLGGVNTVEELARVKQVVVEAVDRRGAAVLNAEDPLVAEMAAATDAGIIYFGVNPNNHVLAAHLAEGERGVTIEDGMIVLATGIERTELVELERVPFTAQGRIGFQLQNALAATAAAWGAGLNPAMIARALTTFKTDSSTVPGRFNVMERDGVEIILDYGHNLGAMVALGDAIDVLGKRHTLMVMGLPGDRRNADLIATFRATFSFADGYFLHDLADRRKRAVNEVPLLLESQLPPGVFRQIVPDEATGIAAALRQARPGDRVLIIADVVDDSLLALEEVMEARARDATCTSPVTAEQQGDR